jgi:AraC family transcriptional regulator
MLRRDMRNSPDQLLRINRAVDFINQNPGEDLGLRRLAALANYSSFHFQRLFTSVVGETPKQYILRIRLETAAHAIAMFLERSITEIALDSGFSSSATFARAFKKYFGISPTELRSLPHEERFRRYSEGKLGKYLLDTDRYFYQARDHAVPLEPGDVRIARLEPARGVFMSCSLDTEDGMTSVWKKLSSLVEANDLVGRNTSFVGALYPHQRLYRAVATVEHDVEVPRSIERIEIEGGKFAVVSVSGPVANTFAISRSLANVWLPESGYRISNIFILEFLKTASSPAPYEEVDREIYIPIAPAR